MTTLNFSAAPASGATHNAANGLQYVYDGVKWTSQGAYASGLKDIVKLDNIASQFNGSLTSFNLTANLAGVNPLSAESLTISLGGVIQEPQTAYTINSSAGTITFASAPAAGTTFYGVLQSRLPVNTAAIGTLGDGAVSTEGKLANGIVTEAKLGTGAVTEAKLGTGAVTEAKLGTGAVTEAKLGTGAVTEAKLGTNAVTNAKVHATAAIDATKLSFTQTGTGAVARTVDSKLEDVVSVKDFGAKGDNSTDDTAAIQAAITAAKHVVFPEGTYLINNKLDVTQTDAYIEGLGTVEIKQTTYPQHVFFVTADNCTIRNLKLTGVPTKTQLSTTLANRYFGDTLSSKSSAIYLKAADNLDVLDCNIVKFFAGVKLRGGQSHSYKTGLTGDRMTTTTFDLDSSDQQADDFWQGDATNGFGYIRVLSDDGSTNFVRLSDYVNSTNRITFGTAQTDINLTGSNTFAYNLIKGRSKNILISRCRFDLVDMGVLGNHVENLVVEDCIFETIEQTQQTNVRPHSIYLTGGDNKKVKASGLITYNSKNGDAYKFLAVDGLFLSDLDAYNSRGTMTAEGCINVTANNLTCLLSGHGNDMTTSMVNITASRNVYISDATLTIDEAFEQTAADFRPHLINITGSNDISRGDLGTMLASATIAPTDIHIKDIVVDAQGYTGTVRGVVANLNGGNTAFILTKSTFENIGIVNGSAGNFNAARIFYGDNITIRYPSYTKGDAPNIKQVDLGNASNTIVVFHPDQADFNLVNNGSSAATNTFINAAAQAKGRWTPSITGTGGSANTQGTQVGDWVKVGDLVHVTCRVSITTKNATGDVFISGLPFISDTIDASSGASFFQSGTLGFYDNVNFSNEHVILTIARNDTKIKLQYAGTTGITDVDHAQLTNTTRFDFSFTYKAGSYTDFTPA
jgi:hypothetical protein